jgi:L-alanine-DL-glutamate epimerase-like enolase superfamily enzyme
MHLLNPECLKACDAMKIKRIEIFPVNIRLKEPFIISLGEMQFAENVIVRIITSEGIIGYGECSPFASINGETAGTCMAAGKIIGKGLIGLDPSDTEGCSALMDSIIYGNTAIKSAFDIALFDLASRAAAKPLWEFLGGLPGRSIVTDYTVSIAAPEKMADDAEKIARSGFGIIKVKLGKNGKTDVERIRKIRERIGMEVILRTDANQGWEKDEAIRTLRELAGFDIQFCEEPVSRKQFMDLPEIKAKSPVPLMADESCFDHCDARNLVSINACDLFNIKLGKSSGITGAMKIMRVAGEAGIRLQAGGFLESRLGFTASAHLATTDPNIEFFDLDSPLFMEEDPVEGGIQYGPAGDVSLPAGPGLGATIDPKFLKDREALVIT